MRPPLVNAAKRWGTVTVWVRANVFDYAREPVATRSIYRGMRLSAMVWTDGADVFGYSPQRGKVRLSAPSTPL